MTSSLFALALDGSWVVPLVGGIGFVAAVLIGRRLFAPRPAAPAPLDVPLDGCLQGVTQDRRAAPRRGGNTVEVQITDVNSAPAGRGCVIDRSQGGLRMLVERPVAAGTQLKVKPTSADASAPWSDITVRSCRRDGIEYVLGCQFDRLPNWAELLQFG